MIEIIVKHNLKEAMRDVELFHRRHIPFAIAKSMTEVAITATKKIRTEMVTAFDRPTPYSLNSLRWRGASVQKLESSVWVKNKGDAGKGNSAEDYLLPEVFGGVRNAKRFERALISRGIMPPGYYAVAGSGAQRDIYGNISAAQIRQILSYFGAAELRSGYSANTTIKQKARLAKRTKTRRGFTYFVAGKGISGGGVGRIPPGVYQRIATGFGSAIKPILIFVSVRPTYRQRLDMDGIVRRTADKALAYEFERALRMAIQTSNYKGFWRG